MRRLTDRLARLERRLPPVPPREWPRHEVEAELLRRFGGSALGDAVQTMAVAAPGSVERDAAFRVVLEHLPR